MNQYRLGRELNSLKSQLSNIDSEINRLEDKLRHTDDKDKRRRLQDELNYLYDLNSAISLCQRRVVKKPPIDSTN